MPQPNNEGNILLALQALQNDRKLSLRQAAKTYEVGYYKLRRRHNGIQSRHDWIPKSRKLSDLEEETIVKFIIDLDSRGFPPRLRGVEEMANKLLADRNASPVGKRWASNFVKRQPDLKTRFNRRYDYQRAKCEDPTIIRDWFRLVEDTIAKYGITLVDIYNFDETGFMMGLIASGMVVTDPESVISKLDVRLQTPTPVEEEASLPDPWVPKTPKTVLEATSQSEYLERRIRQHQSSSPASILEVLKSFSKGTMAIMHQMTLLKSENQMLRQSNETLSKRRRAKRRRLQNTGTMTVDDGC
ncbi:hypothetical protein CFIMG_007618RA00001 [Ceratocystis fimbriata CBS 114723]|uniref:HTH CENPB-type domain-containing protein n=1 Tax=Ceratocystis fimbriata CBS 114723 TaxID=1035309 RepID=A0A2C5XEW9_9PEZI|nr:hypothetical protein CFIMG_007618RA00001 [Ceratocystis fimbriata CBS 114723]